MLENCLNCKPRRALTFAWVWMFIQARPQTHENVPHQMRTKFPRPDAPCMDYLPTFGEKWPHELREMYVGKYSHPMEHLGRQMQRPILWVRKRSRWWFQVSNIFYFHPYLGK